MAALKGVILRLAILSVIASSAEAAWTPGREVEVDPGTYATMMIEHEGWRLWRFATKSGVACKLAKPAQGRMAPEPIGFSYVLGGDRTSPNIEVTFDNRSPLYPEIWRLNGAGVGGGSRQYRLPTDRFWTDWNLDTNIEKLDGQVIEVAVTSYEYPDVLVGMTREQAMMDLSGLGVMVAMGRECANLL